MQLQLLTLALLWAHEWGDRVTRGGKPAQRISGAEGWLLFLYSHMYYVLEDFTE